jgi:hypothetical protein
MQRNHIACAILVWIRLKAAAKQAAVTMHQLKRGMLSRYLREELRSPAIRMVFCVSPIQVAKICNHVKKYQLNQQSLGSVDLANSRNICT